MPTLEAPDSISETYTDVDLLAVRWWDVSAGFEPATRNLKLEPKS